MSVIGAFGEPSGQDWTQVAGFAIAFGLSSLIGLERELKQKAAGIRTYTVVGVGTALFVLVSKYGFTDVLQTGLVNLDPSRVAAQIVSGLGFIGGGIIFVKRDVVRGLTTAASIWMTAAIAAAAAAGLPVLAVLGSLAYFIAILLLPICSRSVARLFGTYRPVLRVSYIDGHGVLREVLEVITQTGFAAARITSARESSITDARDSELRVNRIGPVADREFVKVAERAVSIQVLLGGRGNMNALSTVLNEIAGVFSVDIGGEPEE